MKGSTILGLAALVVMAFCSPALASVEIIKWEQLPDYETGFDLQSQWDRIDSEPDLIKADDWICPDGNPVTDIHWWGSYYADDRFEPNGFYTNIYANNPMAPGPADDLPGDFLWGVWTDFVGVNETDTGQTDSEGEKVYYYTMYLPDDPSWWFHQQRGTKYWLSIVADTPDIGDIPIWGWHTGFEPDVQGLSSAVTGKVLTGDDFARGNPAMWEPMSYNMAFRLTTIPEPGTLAMLGVGALGLLVFRRKK